MRSDEADRVEDLPVWPEELPLPSSDPGDESVDPFEAMAEAHREAARSGAEWFAAEFERRSLEDERQLERRRRAMIGGRRSDPGLVDASVEEQLIGGAPRGLGFDPA